MPFSILHFVTVEPQADHPNCSRHRDVTRDMWSKTFTVSYVMTFIRPALGFIQLCKILCFMKHFYRSRHSGMKPSAGVMKDNKCMGSQVARNITMPRTVRMVRLWLNNHFLLVKFSVIQLFTSGCYCH